MHSIVYALSLSGVHTRASTDITIPVGMYIFRRNKHVYPVGIPIIYSVFDDKGIALNISDR